MWNLEIFSQQKVGEYLLVMSYEMTGRECTGESNGKLRRSSGSGGEGRMCCDTDRWAGGEAGTLQTECGGGGS